MAGDEAASAENKQSDGDSDRKTPSLGNETKSSDSRSSKEDIPLIFDSTNTSNDTPEYQTAAEYAQAVNQWLWQCYYWQSVAAGFPYFLSNALRQGSGTFQSGPYNIFQGSGSNLNGGLSGQPVAAQGASQGGVNGSRRGRELHIPPLWKRFAAEFVDFFILFILKLLVTFIAIDFFDIMPSSLPQLLQRSPLVRIFTLFGERDLEKYDFESLREDLLDYKLAIEMTSEIVLLEIIHRFVVCFFEALCLHRGTVTRGGATPGKSLLGLKVVSCESIIDLGQGNVLVYPAGDMGFAWALLRSFVKNFSLAFFFPICFTLFMFQHNRTAYDILCNCVVVEESSVARR